MLQFICMNSYETACKTNKLAEKFDDKLHEIFKMIDNHENENAIDFEIDELENIYKNIEINEGLSGIFKHYARNLTASIRTYKDSDKDVTLSDLDSEDLIYISSMIDKVIEEEVSN